MATLTITIETHAGDRPMRMNFDDGFPNELLILRQLQMHGAYEPELTNLMLRVLRDGDAVIDVGANVGYFSMLAATCVGPNGRVLAYEPDPDNIARIEKNVADNSFGSVVIGAAPVHSAVEDVTFHFNADNNGGNALWDPGQFPENVASRAAPRRVTMRSTTLDLEAAKHDLGKLKLIKIDTEGAEYGILKGAADLIRDGRVPFIVAELHEFGLKQMGASAAEFRAYMEDMGYSTFVLHNDDALPRLIPPGTRILAPAIINLLFSTPDAVGQYWTAFYHDPRHPSARPAKAHG